MRKVLLLVLIIGCTNSPTEVTTKAKKNNSDSATTITQNKVNKTFYKSLKEALLNPDKVDTLSIDPQQLEDGYKTKHLPADIGKLTHLKVLEIHCLENLEGLPTEIGNLKSLETLDMDEGNGCQMNISLPASIGNLSNLKELILYGALDNRFDTGEISATSPQLKLKELPQTIVNLQNLEVLDLGRNGLKEIPPQVYSLHKLKILRLDYNDIREIPSSISDLTNLKELSIGLSASEVKLPESMKAFKGLKVNLAYETLDEPGKKELADQRKLQEEFPNIVFSYHYLDD